jgi:WD40 repeat protein
MSSKMLYEAIALIRASKLDEARKMIFEIIRNEPTNEMAWMWLAETLSSDTDRMKVLLACQLENPNSRITKMAIEKLQEKMDLDAEQAPSAAPFKEGATFDPSMPERTGHTGAIIGFDGSFIVSEVSDFDDVIDLRLNEEKTSSLIDDTENTINLDHTQVFEENYTGETEPAGFVFEELNEDDQHTELEFEPDLSNLFQDEKFNPPVEKAFEIDESFDFSSVDDDEDDQSFDIFLQENETISTINNDELTAFDLGFLDDSPTVISEPIPSEEDTDRIRTLMREDELVEDRVIESGVEEFERRRKKKDRNLIILVIGLFITIGVLCIVAVFVILNYSNFTDRTPDPTATLPVVLIPEEIPTATLTPTVTNTPAPTATPTLIPTATPLVDISDNALSPDNIGLLQIKFQKDIQDGLALSLDGDKLAFADGRSIALIDSMDGSQLFELGEHTANVSEMKFSTDGNYLVSAATDFSIYLWELNSGTLIKRFVFDANAISRIYGPSGNNFPRDISVDYSPDGSTIAAGTFGFVSIFDIPTGLSRGQYEIEVDELKTVAANAGSLHGFSVKFNENGWVLTAAMSGYLVGLDTLDATPLYKFNLGSNAKIYYSDDRLEMVEADNGGIAFREIDTGEIYNGFGGVENKPDQTHPIYGLSNNWEVVGIESDADENDVQLTIWNIIQDREITSIPAVCETTSCRLPVFQISPEGDWIAVELFDGKQILVDLFDLVGQTQIHQLDKFSSSVQFISISPSSELIAVLNQNGVLRVWDVKFGAQRVSLDASGLTKIEFSKNGRYLFGWNSEEFIVWSIPE